MATETFDYTSGGVLHHVYIVWPPGLDCSLSLPTTSLPKLSADGLVAGDILAEEVIAGGSTVWRFISFGGTLRRISSRIARVIAPALSGTTTVTAQILPSYLFSSYGGGSPYATQVPTSSNANAGALTRARSVVRIPNPAIGSTTLGPVFAYRPNAGDPESVAIGWSSTVWNAYSYRVLGYRQFTDDCNESEIAIHSAPLRDGMTVNGIVPARAVNAVGQVTGTMVTTRSGVQPGVVLAGTADGTSLRAGSLPANTTEGLTYGLITAVTWVSGTTVTVSYAKITDCELGAQDRDAFTTWPKKYSVIPQTGADDNAGDLSTYSLYLYGHKLFLAVSHVVDLDMTNNVDLLGETIDIFVINFDGFLGHDRPNMAIAADLPAPFDDSVVIVGSRYPVLCKATDLTTPPYTDYVRTHRKMATCDILAGGYGMGDLFSARPGGGRVGIGPNPAGIYDREHSYLPRPINRWCGATAPTRAEYLHPVRVRGRSDVYGGVPDGVFICFPPYVWARWFKHHAENDQWEACPGSSWTPVPMTTVSTFGQWYRTYDLAMPVPTTVPGEIGKWCVILYGDTICTDVAPTAPTFTTVAHSTSTGDNIEFAAANERWEFGFGTSECMGWVVADTAQIPLPAWPYDIHRFDPTAGADARVTVNPGWTQPTRVVTDPTISGSTTLTVGWNSGARRIEVTYGAPWTVVGDEYVRGSSSQTALEIYWRLTRTDTGHVLSGVTSAWGMGETGLTTTLLAAVTVAGTSNLNVPMPWAGSIPVKLELVQRRGFMNNGAQRWGNSSAGAIWTRANEYGWLWKSVRSEHLLTLS